MVNKNILKYLLLGTVFYTVTFLYFKHFLGYTFITEGITDKYYCFQFGLYFLCGCNLIDKQFSYMKYTRVTKRTEIIKNHALAYFFLSFVQVSIVYMIGLLHYITVDRYVLKCEINIVANNYVLFILATIVLSILTLVFRYSGVKVFKQFPHIMAYFVLILEVMIIIPRIRKFSLLDIKCIFTMMFYEKSYVNAIFLGIYSIVGILVLFLLARRVDLD